MPLPIVRLEKVTKIYQIGSIQVPALRGISLTIESGEYLSVMGPSGGGKSTLLNILGCLDRPSEGRYYLGDQEVSGLGDDDLSDIRGRRLGFIFQSYNLIQELSVLENIEVPLYYQGWPENKSREVSLKLSKRVGLEHRLAHRPHELSGGQQQRVAIARALVNDPLVILADEATGNLDSQSGEEILDLFGELHDQGKTLIMVTHDPMVASRTNRQLHLKDGILERDERK